MTRLVGSLDQERAVTCPTCGAKPGSPCMRPSGHRVFGGASHAPRYAAFEMAKDLATVDNDGPKDAAA